MTERGCCIWCGKKVTNLMDGPGPIEQGRRAQWSRRLFGRYGSAVVGERLGRMDRANAAHRIHEMTECPQYPPRKLRLEQPTP